MDPLSFISKGCANILDWYWTVVRDELAAVDGIVYGVIQCIDIVDEDSNDDLNL